MSGMIAPGRDLTLRSTCPAQFRILGHSQPVPHVRGCHLWCCHPGHHDTTHISTLALLLPCSITVRATLQLPTRKVPGPLLSDCWPTALTAQATRPPSSSASLAIGPTPLPPPEQPLAKWRIAHDPLISSAASHWTNATLNALNASYDRHTVTDFDFSDMEIPSPLKEGTFLAPFAPFPVNKHCVDIDSLVNSMLSVNNSERITPEFRFTASSHPPLILFQGFYEQLSLVLARDPSPDHPQPQTSLDITPPRQIASPPPATDPPHHPLRRIW